MSDNRLTADQARKRTKEAKEKLNDHPAVGLFLNTIYDHIERASDQGESSLVIGYTKILNESLTHAFTGIPDTIQRSIYSQLENDGYTVEIGNQSFRIDW